MSEVEKAKKKAGPGRPVTVRKNNVPFLGVVNSIPEDNICIKMVYSNPETIRKIFEFFRTFKTKNIQFLFRKTELVLYALDHEKQTHIKCTLYGNELNLYYNKFDKEHDVELSEGNIENVMSSISGDYQSIEISISEKLENDKYECMTFQFVDTVNSTQIHNVQFVTDHNKLTEQIDEEFNDEDYMVKFTLTTPYYKKIIEEIKYKTKSHVTFSCDTHKSIKKDSEVESKDKTLHLIYKSTNKKIDSVQIFDSKTIQLEHKLKNVDDNLELDVGINHLFNLTAVKTFTKSFVKILLDENKKIMNICEIKDVTGPKQHELVKDPETPPSSKVIAELRIISPFKESTKSNAINPYKD